MSNEYVNGFEPEDGVAFELSELVEALAKARNEAMDESEPFPFVFLADGQQIGRITLERVRHSDGSSNIEVRLHLAD